MKLSIFLAALFLVLGIPKINSQHSSKNSCRIEYAMVFNSRFDGGKSFNNFNSVLLIEDNVSLFYSRPEKNVKQHDDGLNYDVFSDTTFKVVKNFEKSALLFEDRSFTSKKLVYNDTLHPMQWLLTSEERKIDSLTCFKAVCYFKKRNYVAWYCPSIPIQNGPWKLGGLPGLVVEAYDENKDLYFILSRISFTSENINISEVGSSLSYQDYVSNAKKFLRKIEGNMQASGDNQDCITCEQKSTITLSTWEKIFQ
jgi:GLPGLI family protein